MHLLANTHLHVTNDKIKKTALLILLNFIAQQTVPKLLKMIFAELLWVDITRECNRIPHEARPITKECLVLLSTTFK